MSSPPAPRAPQLDLEAMKARYKTPRYESEHGIPLPTQEEKDIVALLAEVEALRAALVAAKQFLEPEVSRGPAVYGWENTMQLVKQALGDV